MTSRERLSHGTKQLVAGGLAGLAASVVSTPFDVCKTILQVQKRPSTAQLPSKYSGVVGTFRTIHREEGIRGIYRGLGTTMMALAPNWAVYFYMYTQFKHLGLSSGYFKEGPYLYICTAMSAAAVTELFCNPLWMIKTRLQAQPAVEPRKYRSTLHAFSSIIREEGPRALWQGFIPQLFGVVHVAIQFPLYEHLKKVLSEGEQRPTLSSPVQIVLAASISKACASVVAYPHEILRSRLQYQRKDEPNRYQGVMDAVVRISREEGFRAFYRGMAANLLRVVPSCIVTFTAYETALKFLENL
jgi:solute carrier family 25 folate transporter 32